MIISYNKSRLLPYSHFPNHRSFTIITIIILFHGIARNISVGELSLYSSRNSHLHWMMLLSCHTSTRPTFLILIKSSRGFRHTSMHTVVFCGMRLFGLSPSSGYRNPERRSSKFLWNVGNHTLDYGVLDHSMKCHAFTDTWLPLTPISSKFRGCLIIMGSLVF
jgi:hypothetical protein